jgi:exonuclease SbcC
VRLAEQRVAGIEREAGRAALKAEELARRFGLTGEVPCAGTDLQGRCKLLGDAREAQALIPNAQAQVARLAGEKSEAKRELTDARQRCEALAGAPQALAQAEFHETVARERVNRLSVMCSKAQACAQAQATLVEVERELQALGPEVGAGAAAETADERAERQQIAAARQAIEAATGSTDHALRRGAGAPGSSARVAAVPPSTSSRSRRLRGRWAPRGKPRRSRAVDAHGGARGADARRGRPSKWPSGRTLRTPARAAPASRMSWATGTSSRAA